MEVTSKSRTKFRKRSKSREQGKNTEEALQVLKEEIEVVLNTYKNFIEKFGFI